MNMDGMSERETEERRSGLFITGTDTDVGKTAVAAAVLTLLRGRGIDAVPMKPVQTGAVRVGGRMTSPDLDFCFRMAGLEAAPEEYADMAPFLHEPACSPHLAARKAGLEISLERIEEAFRELLESHESVVVEGAGGVLVPITRDKTMLDLMALLGLPVILAARPGLGTINHTLLSLREMERAGLTVLGVVFCETKAAEWGEIEDDNWKTIERMGKTPVLGCIPYMEGLGDGRVSPDAFRMNACGKLRLP